MKCLLCEKRKPKRYCPAKRAEICPVCCGEKRGVEINCPLDCRYFVEGQKQHHIKIMHRRIRKEGAGTYVRRAELYGRNPEIFARLEMTFARAFRENNEIKNEDLVKALELVNKTLETEKKGLIYQHQGDNSYVNVISESVLTVISEYKDKPDVGGNRVTLDFASDVIDEFLNEAKFYMENGSNQKSYLIHILRYYPDEAEPQKSPEGGLIITP
jgi:hypothetical protein